MFYFKSRIKFFETFNLFLIYTYISKSFPGCNRFCFYFVHVPFVLNNYIAITVDLYSRFQKSSYLFKGNKSVLFTVVKGFVLWPEVTDPSPKILHLEIGFASFFGRNLHYRGPVWRKALIHEITLPWATNFWCIPIQIYQLFIYGSNLFRISDLNNSGTWNDSTLDITTSNIWKNSM